MPKLSATDSPLDAIKRVDISPEDIRSMSDDELTALLARIRTQREAAPVRPSRAKKPPTTSSPTRPEALYADDDDDIDQGDIG